MSAWLVVGLGNPGPTYAVTRHNAGFFVADELAVRARVPFTAPRGMRGDVCETRLGASGMGGVGADAERVVLLKPRTFMNDSGVAVKAIAAFHKIAPDHVIAVHDELDLDPGRLRVKLGGGDNGHNGLKSMRAHLGTGGFYRVRVGIGRPAGRQSAADYVLNKLKPAQADEMRVDAAVAADAVEFLVREGLTATQNRFNG